MVRRIILYVLTALPLMMASSCATRKVAQSGEALSLSDEEVRRHDYFFLEATRQRERGEHADAMALYEHCLSIHPQSAAVMYELAQYCAYLGQVERTRELLERAVELQPDNFWYRQTLGAFYRNQKENGKAIAVYEDMSRKFPGRSEILMMLMDLYNQEQDFPNLIRALDRLEQKEGKSEALSMEKYRIYHQMGDKEHAFNEIEALAKEYPNDVRYRVMLGDSYLDNDRADEALKIFQQVLAEDPGNPMGQISLASYYERQGMDSLFLLQQEELVMNSRLEPQEQAGVMHRIVMESEQKGRDSVRILQLFDTLMVKAQDDIALPVLYLGYMEHKKMGDEKKVPVLEKILSIEPDNIAARYNLLMVAVKKDDYAEAVRICEPAIQYNPEEMSFYYYLGISYFRVDRKDDALETLRKGVKQVTPESDKKLVSDFYTFIGDLEHEAGRVNLAYAAYDSALVYNPDNIGVLNNYAYFLSQERKNLDKAEEMSYKAIKAEPGNSTYLDTYAWILFEKGRYAEAKIYIDEAMKHGGDQSAVIVEHCGDIYFMSGEKDRAIELWKQASRMEHDSKTLEEKVRRGRL